MSKVLTVGIAAYQAEETLRETLESLAGVAALDELDVIVVDDGSKDGTAAIAQEYVNTNPASFRLCSKENAGWGSTVNKSIELAQGVYFLQLDSDDYLQNVDAFLAYLRRCDTDLVFAPTCTFRSETGEVLKLWEDPSHSPLETALPFQEATVLASVHNLAFRTEMLKENRVSVMEHCFYTDVELVLRACAFAQSISFFGKPVYYYRLAYSGQSMSKKGIRAHYHDHLRVTEALLDEREKHANAPHVYDLFTRRMTGMGYYNYLFFFALPCTARQKRELIAYDAMLQKKAPDIYQGTSGPLVNLLRKLRFNGYWPIAHLKTTVDRIRRQNIYQAD